jgi:surface protein
VFGRTRESTYVPPQVTYTIPKKNDTNVAVSSIIVIAFNRELNRETINKDTIVLRDPNGEEVPVNLNILDNNSVVNLDPVDDLEYGIKYYITVSSSIEDTQGDDLKDDYLFSFDTEVNWTAGFITTWKTDNPGISEENQITIQVYSEETYDYFIDWGDGTTDSHLTSNTTHTYDIPGIYTVTISGKFPRIYFNNTGDNEKILTIERWGEIEWTSMESAFSGCTNLTYNAIDAPDLSNVTDISSMFHGASSFNGDLNSWDVSNVIDMRGIFGNARLFNGEISMWNVSSVIDMRSMFSFAISFNRDISDWDVSNVENMNQMFYGARSFNGNISNWNVSNVKNMREMFRNAIAFNRNISNWDVSSVTDTSFMFNIARSFNGDISEWDVSSVISMVQMFNYATSFNGNISGWDVSSVKNMRLMFSNATSFNGDISYWDVSNVRYMYGMFGNASSFNRDISNWDVSNVVDMSGMFTYAISFNGNISEWDVGNVIYMDRMFYRASSFSNHDLSGWTVSPYTSHTDFSTGWGEGNIEPEWP